MRVRERKRVMSSNVVQGPYHTKISFRKVTNMKDLRAFRAMGICLALITLRICAPDIWHAMEAVLLQFFSTLQRALAIAPGDILQGNVISVPRIPVSGH